MTALIAWSAFTVSVLSLTWQVLSWVHAGARIFVKSAEEVLFHDPQHRRIVVVATNYGRLATTVHEATLKLTATTLNDGTEISPVTITAGSAERGELPARIEPGDEIVIKFDDPGLADFFHLGIEADAFTPSVRAGRKWVKGRYSAGERRVDFDPPIN